MDPSRSPDFSDAGEVFWGWPSSTNLPINFEIRHRCIIVCLFCVRLNIYGLRWLAAAGTPGRYQTYPYPHLPLRPFFNTPFPPLIPTKTLCKKPWLEVTRGKSQNCALYTLFQEHACTRITDEDLRAWCILNLFWDSCFILSISPFQRLTQGFVKNTWARNEEENPFIWDMEWKVNILFLPK